MIHILFLVGQETKATLAKAVCIDVFIGNYYVGTCQASKYRCDLATVFEDDGFHGFVLEIPHHINVEKDVAVSARFSENGKDLLKSPRTFRFGSSGKSHRRFSNANRQILSKINANLVSKKLNNTALVSATATELKVSLIILNLNGGSLLSELFESFKNYNTYSSVELMIVDHGSTDKSIEVCKYWSKFLPIKIIPRKHNYSFSESNNYAAKQSDSDLLMFLNNDITFCQDIIPDLVEMIQQEDIGLVGIKLLDILDEKTSQAFPPIQHLGVKFDFYNPKKLFTPFDLHYLPNLIGICNNLWYTPCVTGAAALCTKQDFLAIGGFCEEYFYGYEDVDLSLTMGRDLGKKIVCANNLTALHHRGFTRFKATSEFECRMSRNADTINSRFGYYLKQIHKKSMLENNSFWSSGTLRIGFIVTEANFQASAGDFFTAYELGNQFVEQFGWEVSYLSKNEDWYDLQALDVIIVMRDDYDLRKIYNTKPSLIKVIWIRNWFDRLLERKWVKEYDCIWSSSNKSADYLSQKLSKLVNVVRIGTDPERFSRGEFKPELQSDYCFTGSYWNSPREIIDFLNPDNLPYDFGLYGFNWDQVDKFKDYARSSIAYTEMPHVYASTKIVIDDANIATKEWGSVNSRVFDALGAGTLVITNGIAGSHEVFQGLLPTYDSSESLESLLREYLEDDDKRLTLVGKLQELVRQNHTYRERAKTVYSALEYKVEQTYCIAIKIGTPNWDVAHQWGDYHFALALKKVFEAEGHSVRIDILPEWETDKGMGDDVVLVLRGLSCYKPKPHHINIMWNISHPDQVSIHEYEQYDLIFIASLSYANILSNLVEVRVEPLLQCTDPDLFYPDSDLEPESDILFVGNSRKVYRQIVKDAINAELDIGVYGSNWEHLIDRRYIKGEYISNSILRKYYSQCKILLNDHWDNMRKQGFISNRLFDAAACGSLIISDNVQGLTEVFGDFVQIYETSEDLQSKVNYILQNHDVKADSRSAFAHQVREKHSFKARSQVIIQKIREIHNSKLNLK